MTGNGWSVWSSERVWEEYRTPLARGRAFNAQHQIGRRRATESAPYL
jgi:hypothetical protein